MMQKEKVIKRPWWHYILLPIVGIISFIGVAALVVILFN